MFITFEGPEGAGKSTQARRLVERLREQGHPVLATREPGGTEMGERLRESLLAGNGPAVSARAQVLLMCAARVQLVEEVLLPALAQNVTVVCDRFSDSTLAYQAYGHEVPAAEVMAVLAFATRGLSPDLTLLLDVPAEEGLERKRRQSAAAGGVAEWNRFESEQLAFHQRVRDGYLRLARESPRRWCVLDGRLPAEVVEAEIWRAVLTANPVR